MLILSVSVIWDTAFRYWKTSFFMYLKTNFKMKWEHCASLLPFISRGTKMEDQLGRYIMKICA